MSSSAGSQDESEPPSPLPGPPINFSQVRHGIYRSSFPRAKNLDFLEELGLKTVLTLVTGEYPYENREFIYANGIKHIQVGIQAHKHDLDHIPVENLTKALEIVMDESYRPLLVHCNKGKHRTGCVIASYRKICGWPMEDILDEYRQHAGAKSRILDEKFIQSFDAQAMAARLSYINATTLASQQMFLTPPNSLKGTHGENCTVNTLNQVDGERRGTVVKLEPAEKEEEDFSLSLSKTIVSPTHHERS